MSLMFTDTDWVSRSIMKCILFETEDDVTVDTEYKEEHLKSCLRGIRLFFDAMDLMGFRKVKFEVFNHLTSFGYEGEYLKLLQTNDRALIDEYCRGFEHWAFCHDDYFEEGDPEEEINCNESCRHSAKLVSKEVLANGGTASMLSYTRDVKCDFHDML